MFYVDPLLERILRKRARPLKESDKWSRFGKGVQKSPGWGAADGSNMAWLIESFRRLRVTLAGLSFAPIRYAYLGDHVGVVLTHRGYRLLIDTRDRGIAPHLALTGRWEPYVERTLVRLIKRGQRVVEVGANVGYHTLTMASLVGPTGRIDSFEPNPRLHSLLTDTILLNGFHNVVSLHQKAVQERAETVMFQFEPRYMAGGNVVVPGDERPSYEKIEVPAVRLDDVITDGQPVDLLRMDAEGCEPLVLHGAQDLLRRSPRLRILMEFSPTMMRSRADVPAFVGWLETLGFKAWRITPEGALVSVAMADLPGASHWEVLLSRDVPPGAR